MRTIKFRGKIRNSDRWIFGSYNQLRESITWDDGNHNDYFVYDETVGQYTGLRDINDKDIYEGDIVRIQSFVNNGGIFRPEELSVFTLDDLKGHKLSDFIDVLKFDEGAFSVRDIYLFPFYGDMRYFYPIYEIEVIGNIYDNPDLLDLIKK